MPLPDPISTSAPSAHKPVPTAFPPQASTEAALAGLLCLGSTDAQTTSGVSPTVTTHISVNRGGFGPHSRVPLRPAVGVELAQTARAVHEAWQGEASKREALAEFAAATAGLRSAQQASTHWPTAELDQPCRLTSVRTGAPPHAPATVAAGFPFPPHAAHGNFTPLALAHTAQWPLTNIVQEAPASVAMSPHPSHESAHLRWSQSSQGSHASPTELRAPPAPVHNQGRRGSLSVPPPALPAHGLLPPGQYSYEAHVFDHAPLTRPQPALYAQPYHYIPPGSAVPDGGSASIAASVALEPQGLQQQREGRRPAHGVPFWSSTQPSHQVSHSKPAAFSLPPIAGVGATGLEGGKRGWDEVASPADSGVAMSWQLGVNQPDTKITPQFEAEWVSLATDSASTVAEGSSVDRGAAGSGQATKWHPTPASTGWDFELPASKRRRATLDDPGTCGLQPAKAGVDLSGEVGFDSVLGIVPPAVPAAGSPVFAPTSVVPPHPGNVSIEHGGMIRTASPSETASFAFFDNSEPAGPAASAPQPADAPPANPLPAHYPLHNLPLALRSPPEAEAATETGTDPTAPLPASEAPAPPPAPREQARRWPEDGYTPLWVRRDGRLKEGWCALCPGEGKWLCLKNSEYWYHRQFHHGISSVSGRPFLPPYEVREVEREASGAGAGAGGAGTGGGKLEGLCHSCGDWQPYSNPKAGAGEHRGAPNVWFRHAHSCHVLIKPKRDKVRGAGRRAGTPEA